MKTSSYILLMAVAFGAALMIAFSGCQSPEPFHVAQCADKPGGNFLYSCEDGTYRCDNPDGTAKYVECQLDEGHYCVEACR